ncbi:unnamed protein product [Prunus armeniaca]|uniref:Uncharacterized protein n=1 Tax=Prunus armeniaca TaxID=36596 RepID=A0A6J5VAI6_PRUAR|nr:unnamed protein product [Prunus armeniaca]
MNSMNMYMRMAFIVTYRHAQCCAVKRHPRNIMGCPLSLHATMNFAQRGNLLALSQTPSLQA